MLFFLFGGHQDRPSAANVHYSKSQIGFLDRSYQRKSRSRHDIYMRTAAISKASSSCDTLGRKSYQSMATHSRTGIHTPPWECTGTEGKFKLTCPCYGFIQHVFSPPRSCSARILNLMDAIFVSRWDPDILNYCVRAKGSQSIAPWVI